MIFEEECVNFEIFDVVTHVRVSTLSYTRFLARDSMSAICYRNSVCLSVCLSVTRLDHSKTVEVRIMQFSPYSSPVPVVFAG